MSHESDYIAQVTKDFRERNFKDHVANMIVPAADCSVINWANPKSWNYGMRIIIHRRWLCIVGDCDEATYEWGQDLTLEFLGGLDFHYFKSKCQASPSGRAFNSWSGEVARANVMGRIKELDDLDEEDREEGHSKELEVLLDAADDGCCEERMKAAAQEYYDEHGDAEGASHISMMGLVPDTDAIAHFVGLQMAIAQLKAGGCK